MRRRRRLEAGGGREMGYRETFRALLPVIGDQSRELFDDWRHLFPGARPNGRELDVVLVSAQHAESRPHAVQVNASNTVSGCQANAPAPRLFVADAGRVPVIVSVHGVSRGAPV